MPRCLITYYIALILIFSYRAKVKVFVEVVPTGETRLMLVPDSQMTVQQLREGITRRLEVDVCALERCELKICSQFVVLDDDAVEVLKEELNDTANIRVHLRY